MTRNSFETMCEVAFDPQMQWALEVLRRLKTDGFYGKLVLSFESGAVTHAEQQQKLKPPRQ